MSETPIMGIWNRIISGINSKSMNIKKNSFLRDNLELLFLTLPALLYFFIWHYLPMAGLVIAFKDYRYDKGIFGSDWVGFRNFEFFFTSQDAWRVTRNTVGYGAAFIITGIIAGVTMALLMFEIKSGLFRKIYQTTLILPRFLSWVIVGYISYALLNPVHGLINQITGISVQWFGEVKYWPYIIIFTQMWQTVGLNSIIYFASLMGINIELFEAAMIDGAGKMRQMWHISLPSLTPLMSVLALLAIGRIFRGDFGLFYQIPRNVGILYPVTDIIDTYVFRGLRAGDYPISAAVGFFQSAAGLVLVVLCNWAVKKIDPEKSLF